MKRNRMVIILVAAAMSGMILRCDNGTGPAEHNTPDTPPGRVLLSEGFEGDSLSEYKQISYYPGDGKMSLSKQHAFSGKGSCTSDSNRTGILKALEETIDDSIAGLQFYLMATEASHTNLFVAIAKNGSSLNGLFTIMGMGIDRSDSLQIVYEAAPIDPSNEYKNIAPLKLNKWYKCVIEYNYSDTTLSYFVDDAVVYQRGASNPMTLTRFVAMRDTLGVQGPSGYYVDDVAIYKR